MKRIVLALALCATSLAGLSQTPSPELYNTRLMKPPVGARVAVYEFEDLECPACAHAYPTFTQPATSTRFPSSATISPGPFTSGA